MGQQATPNAFVGVLFFLGVCQFRCQPGLCCLQEMSERWVPWAPAKKNTVLHFDRENADLQQLLPFVLPWRYVCD